MKQAQISHTFLSQLGSRLYDPNVVVRSGLQRNFRVSFLERLGASEAGHSCDVFDRSRNRRSSTFGGVGA